MTMSISGLTISSKAINTWTNLYTDVHYTPCKSEKSWWIDYLFFLSKFISDDFAGSGLCYQVFESIIQKEWISASLSLTSKKRSNSNSTK